MARERTEPSTEVVARNQVVLVGRVAAAPVERELPSGDVLLSVRLVVDRPAAPPRTPGGRVVTVDALDCTCWTPGTRRSARRLVADDVVEVTGSLRRRFWRAGQSAASRTEVEVATLRRLTRAPAPKAPGRPRRAAGPSGQPSATPAP